jgi:nucleoside-diphosphate kinase
MLKKAPRRRRKRFTKGGRSTSLPEFFATDTAQDKENDMAVERTMAAIKPDAMEKGIIGEICSRIEDANLKIVGMKMMKLNQQRAEGFYAVHKGKPFFDSLVKFMTSGPCVVMVLEGEGAIAKWRNAMGATNPEDATEGTIRRDFGTTIERNAVHGSDAPDTAKFEVSFFFEPNEIVQYEWM